MECMARKMIRLIALSPEEKHEYWTGATTVDRPATVTELEELVSALLTLYTNVRIMTEQIRRAYQLLSTSKFFLITEISWLL